MQVCMLFINKLYKNITNTERKVWKNEFCRKLFSIFMRESS